MGVYGTYGAFNGLGKPSIKLEFEDNEALLDFQRRMQEGGDNPDGSGNFTQSQLDDAVDEHNAIGWGIKPEIPEGWHVVKTKSAPDGFDVIVKGEPSFKLTTTGWSFKNAMDAALIEKKKGLKATKGGELEGVKGSKAWNDFFAYFANPEAISEKMYLSQNIKDEYPKPSKRRNIYGFKENFYEFKTPINTVYLPETTVLKNHIFKNHPEMFKYFHLIGMTLERPNIIFENVDDETKQIKINYAKSFIDNANNKTIILLTPGYNSMILTSFDVNDSKNYLFNQYTKDGEFTLYTDTDSAALYGASSNDKKLNAPDNSFNLIVIRLPFITENGAKSFVDGEKNSLGAPGDTYIITDTRTRARKDLENTAALKKYDIRKFSGEELQRMQTDDPLLYEQIKSDLQQQKTPIKQEVKTKEDWMQEVDKMLETWKKEAFRKTTPQKFDEPASRVQARYLSNLRDIIIKYFIEEIDKGNFERVSNIANILGYKYTSNQRVAQTNGLISQFVGIVPTLPEGWRISKNIPKWLPKLPKGFVYIDNGKEMFDYRHKIMPTQKGLGKTANDALYNNLEILDFRGMQPTYRQLSNYDGFFKPATNKNSLKGWGLNDTKKLIADICRNHYKECAAIAKHLKAETKLQSAFNLWHWLHHNIRYEYDREGREEVRTPLRTWADRRRGVDCDCLSVFVWCVLKCMGYNPAFELAAFRNKPAYSHIYINLDGIVIDRVWYVFNSRPPFITKTELFKVGMLDNLGQLF